MADSINIPQLGIDVNPTRTPGVIDKLVAPVENAFAFAGLTTPFLRLVGAAAATAGCLLLFKPDAFFSPNGEGRPWAIWTASGADSDAQSTWIPWWLFAALVGLFFAVFV